MYAHVCASVLRMEPSWDYADAVDGTQRTYALSHILFVCALSCAACKAFVGSVSFLWQVSNALKDLRKFVTDVLYYEVLDFSIMELVNKQQLRVTWMTPQTILGVCT